MEVLFLGTGTSHGIPMIGCNCGVCEDAKKGTKNNRKRCSILIKHKNKNILIDTSQDFRNQMLEYDIKHIDAVLFTHLHADHIYGLPDIRAYNQMQKQTINCYGSKQTLKCIKQTFSYIFNPIQVGGGIPRVKLNSINKPLNLFDLSVVPIKVKHGKLDVFGYKINNFAYIPDVNYIPQKEKNKLKNLEVLVIDALRPLGKIYKRSFNRPTMKHSTHFTLEESIEIVKELKPKKCYFIHMTHEIDYRKLKLPENMELAYDGLIINFP